MEARRKIEKKTWYSEQQGDYGLEKIIRENIRLNVLK